MRVRVPPGQGGYAGDMPVLSRIRIPLAAVGGLAVLTLAVVDEPGWARWSATAVFVVGMALYLRLGTPTRQAAVSHVHLQAMDRPSVWVAAGLPLLIEGQELPANGSRLPSCDNSDTTQGMRAAS